MSESDEKVPADYPYTALDFQERLAAARDVEGLTLEQAFEAGQLYGSDQVRAGVYLKLKHGYYQNESDDFGCTLSNFIQNRLVEDQLIDRLLMEGE